MIRLRRPKLSDISDVKKDLITSGCGCRGCNLPGADLFKTACNRHDMHYQAGTGWLFPIAAMTMVYLTGSLFWILLWVGEYMWANVLLLCRSLLEAEEAPSVVSACWHFSLAFVYFLFLSLLGWFTFSYTVIGWRSIESISKAGAARKLKENPRRSLYEVIRSWFGK